MPRRQRRRFGQMHCRSLRFGPIRFRVMLIAICWPPIIGFAVVQSNKLSVINLLWFILPGFVLATRCVRALGIKRCNGMLIVSNFLSTTVIPLKDVSAVQFSRPILSGFPSHLKIFLQNGQTVAASGVSITRPIIDIPSAAYSRRERRVQEFFGDGPALYRR